jgi:hypothetical protein
VASRPAVPKEATYDGAILLLGLRLIVLLIRRERVSSMPIASQKSKTSSKTSSFMEATGDFTDGGGPAFAPPDSPPEGAPRETRERRAPAAPLTRRLFTCRTTRSTQVSPRLIGRSHRELIDNRIFRLVDGNSHDVGDSGW